MHICTADGLIVEYVNVRAEYLLEPRWSSGFGLGHRMLYFESDQVWEAHD